MRVQTKNRLRFLLLAFGCGILLHLLQGCYDSDKVGDNFYTFKGYTVGSYLESDTASYGEFWKAVKRADLEDILKSYNKFTCFAPTNAAMVQYYKDKGVSSLSGLSDSAVVYMVYSHIIPDKVYFGIDMVDGALSFTNMNSRYLVVGRKSQGSKVNLLINTNSTILLQDSKVENGVVHTLDRVLTPTTLGIPKIMSDDNRVSLFAEALNLTGLGDSLQLTRDESYVPEFEPLSIDGTTKCRSPKLRKFGYTVFAESNDVLAAAGIDTTSLEGLKSFAKKVYDEVYPEDASISDVRDRRNSLNRFIAYHIIDKSISYSNFFYVANMAADKPLFEFMETFCPNTMFKMSNEGGVYINKDVIRNVSGIKVLPVEGGRVQDTQNGFYYLIDKPLVYNQKVKTMLLNTRIRMDAASLNPELMTNGIRFEKGIDPSGVTGAQNFYKFPNGYLKNVKFISPTTRLYYLQGQKSSNSWVNYQADEMMAQGQFDFIMRLPPVPAGTYEVRFGYTANPNRGILQFYVDDDNGVLQPRGIPLNMKIDATDPNIGWMPDDPALDNANEIDKMLRNRGYMKGGESYLSGAKSARSFSGAMRRIVCTETWSQDGPHYLRFKNVSDDMKDQFMIDYFELVPTNVFNNPSGEPEDKD